VPAFLLLNGGAVILAILVARAVATRTSLRILCALGGFVIVIHSATLGAGVAGRLTVGSVATVLAPAIVVVAWWTRPARRPSGDDDASPRFTIATAFGPVVALVMGGVWAWPHLVGPTRLWVWDDYTYHMVYPALWLRDTAIAAVSPAEAFTMQAWYPLSASVVSTWFMLPFAGARGEALAWVSLTAVAYAGIMASGAAELLARLGCRPGAWAVPVALFLTSHRIGTMAASFSDADLAHATLLFGAFVFAIPRREVERREDLCVDAAFAALLAGLAVGVKVSAGPTTLIVFLVLAWRARVLDGWIRAAGWLAAVFVAAWAVTGGYWYVRNVIHTGNPVYPAAFLFWPGATFPHTRLREYAQQYGLARTVSDALVVYLNWPRFHAWLGVAGLAGLAVWLAVRRRGPGRPCAGFAAGALAVVAVTLVLLPSAPYSAGNGMTFAAGLIHWDSMRYIALLPILGWVALGFLLDAGVEAPPWRTLAAVAIIAGAVLIAELPLTGAVAVLGAGVVSAAVIARVGVPDGRMRLIGAAVVVVVVVAFLVGSHGAKAAATAAAFYREPLFGAAAAIIDRQPPGTRVAVYGDQWIYPMFGARHDLVPLRVDGNGRIATTPIGDAMTPGDLIVDPFTFRTSLATSYIGLVAVVHQPHPGRSAQWPAQAAVLENVRGTRLLYRDAAVGLWKLGD
jgi:hypothetical protein